MEQEAAAHGSSLPLANRTLECFDRASREGGGEVDGVAYPAYWIARQRAAAKAVCRARHASRRGGLSKRTASRCETWRLSAVETIAADLRLKDRRVDY